MNAVRLAMCLITLGQERVVLDDYNDLWSRATPIHSARVFYHDGVWKDVEKEIGPPGIVRTNGNLEFPWRFPAGRTSFNGATVYGVDVKIVKSNMRPSVILNRMSGHVMQRYGLPGSDYPEWDFSRPFRGSRWPFYAESIDGVKPHWEYAVGSCFFEEHRMFGHVVEVRMRIKTSHTQKTSQSQSQSHGSGGWEFQVFRPIVEHSELVALSGVSAGVVVRRSIEDTVHAPFQAFDRKEVLLLDDGLSDKEYVELCSVVGELRSTLGVNYSDGGVIDRLWKSEPLWVPRALGCVVCHRDTGKHVTYFETPRDWYGHIRGSDGIFTHPTER